MTLSPEEIILLFIAGLVAGFINVMSGGGSLITLPLLIFLGLPSTVANASNRVGIIAQNIFAVAGFRSKGVHAWPYSLYLAIAAALGAILGAWLSVDLDEALFNKIIAVIMVGVVLLTVWKRKRSDAALTEKMSAKKRAVGIGTFFFIGIYGGFIQAGTGFLIIAALTGINGFSLVKTNSAKVLIALIYSLSAMGIFFYEDLVNWEYGLTLGAGTATGGWITSRWSVKTGDRWIRRILLITVISLAVKLWFF